ncbi:hypothetical protein Aperf_G00000063040 [Anoplocephala perfoliata]
MALNMDSLKDALDSSPSFTESRIETVDLEGIANYMRSGRAKNVITAIGAGISTSAGIPDFRSKDTGIYDNLDEYDLPDPMAVFTIEYFEINPKPFFQVAKSLYHPYAKPTIAHYFIKLLNEKGILLRDYTQNADQLERLAGIPEEKIIEAHGSFHTGHCVECRTQYPFEFLKRYILNQEVPNCSKKNCGGVVKPDVVFFGEPLPEKFYTGIKRDFPKCDLLIIMGTSLKVHPFCGIVDLVKPDVPRLLINREYNPRTIDTMPMRFNEPDNKTDVFAKGNTDDVCLKLADLIGWKDDLLRLQSTRNAELELEFEKTRKKATA